jgi:hypothetical protein
MATESEDAGDDLDVSRVPDDKSKQDKEKPFQFPPGADELVEKILHDAKQRKRKRRR